jgi:ribonuclease VapC
MRAGPEEARRAIGDLGVAVLPFTLEDAEVAARLEQMTRARGLSLGDRACLATAKRCGVAAVTANQNWRIPSLGVQVRYIR